MKRLIAFFILLLGAAFFAGGAYWSFTSWQNRLRLGTESTKWPTAPATFESGYVARSNTRNDSTPYQPEISYSFVANGIAQYSDTIAATKRGFRNREQAQAFIDNYPKDNLIAHYNPDNPSQAVLEPGIPFIWRLLVILPILLVAVALFLLGLGIQILIKGVKPKPLPESSNA